MKALDIYIYSSSQEAFGRVLLEAMVAKVPIIATGVNGVPEVIGDTGPLIPPGDINALADEMLKSYQLSAADRQQWGMKGYERAATKLSQTTFHQTFWDILETKA